MIIHLRSREGNRKIGGTLRPHQTLRPPARVQLAMNRLSTVFKGGKKGSLETEELDKDDSQHESDCERFDTENMAPCDLTLSKSMEKYLTKRDNSGDKSRPRSQGFEQPRG